MEQVNLKTILIVDDQEDFAEMIAESIQYAVKCRVVIASNGSEAIEKFSKFKPDVVVTDYHLSGVNGMDIIEQTRACAGKSGFKSNYILLTGDSLANLPKMKLLEYQVSVFVKPFEFKNLVLNVVSLCSSSISKSLLNESLI